MRLRRLLAGVATAAAAVTGVATATTAPATAAPAGFVTRQGTHLSLDGAPYRFTGFNIFNANSRNNCGQYAGTGPALDSYLTAIGPGQTAMRSWFFQSLATAPDGSRDWTAFDHTIAVAKAHHIKIIAGMDNQWGECEGYTVYGTGYKSEAWYAAGYRTTPLPGVTKTYRDWIAELAGHYRNEPTILMWSLMNEPEDAVQYRPRTCSSTAPATLKNWASDVAPVVKAADPNHLVGLGTIGSGQCGAGGRNYTNLYSVPAIDVCELHDYTLTALPGDVYNGMTTRLSECAGLNKPLVISEQGILGSVVNGNLTTRSQIFQSKYLAEFPAGVQGILAWNFRPAAQGGSSTTDFWIGPSDPMVPHLHPVPAVGNGLNVSFSATRAEARPLAEQTLPATGYIALDAPAGTTRVAFYLDNPSASGTPRHVEGAAPWDFAGTAAGTGAANSYDLSGLASGAHTLTAVASGANGVHLSTVTSRFYL